MRVTFDTNAIDKVTRPELFPKDPRQADFIKIHDALKAGSLKGYFGESIATLEGIKKKDRSSVMGSTRVKTEITDTFDGSGELESIKINMIPEQDRHPIPVKHAARIQAALQIGMRALKTPRIGGFRIIDPDFYEPDSSETALSERLNKTMDAVKAIEDRGVGYTVVRSIAAEFARRDNVINEMPMQSLRRARDVHEEGRVSRAVAEWADADTIGAHIGYGIDLFCTGDEGKGAGSPSVLDAANRAWLTATFGVTFVTLSQLAAVI